MKVLVVPESDHIVVPMNFVCVPYYLAEIRVPEYILYLVRCFINHHEIPMVLIKNSIIVGYIFYDREKLLRLTTESKRFKATVKYYDNMIFNYEVNSKLLIESTIKNENTRMIYLGQSLPKVNDLLYCNMNLFDFMERYRTIFVMQPTQVFSCLEFEPDHKAIFDDQIELNLLIDIALVTGVFDESMVPLVGSKRICCI